MKALTAAFSHQVHRINSEVQLPGPARELPAIVNIGYRLDRL